VTSGVARRLNAGSSSNYTDVAGNVWLADRAYAPGSYGFVPSPGFTWVSTNAVSNTSDPTLYRTNHHDTTFEYRFDLPNGNYQVRFKFAEVCPQDFAPNRRVFNVSIENTQVLQNFDIFVAAGGANIATDRIFTTTVADGQLNVVFTGTISHAEVNAIEVIALP
jgi:hypothetical protein